ncbi:MAG: InlB B-repeat-containing protein, partial [bacterium]
NTIFIMPAQNVTVTANFEEIPQIKYFVISSVKEGTGTGGLWTKVDGIHISSYSFVLEGKDVVFTAYPDLGHKVKGWFKDGEPQSETGTTYTVYNLQADVEVEVEFEPSEIAAPDWASEIRIEDYQENYTMDIGDIVYSTKNSGMVTVYNLTDHELRISFSGQDYPGGGSFGITQNISSGSYQQYGSVGGQKLLSVEPYSDEWGSGWAITFVYP